MKLALLALAVATPQQFDLVCTGPVPANLSFAEPANVRLRVDLAAKRWCQADCKVTHDIAEVQPARIFLEMPSDEEKARELGAFRAVDRETGEYFYHNRFLILGRPSMITKAGLCEPAPFSGFPEPQTKF